ncbi:hypothetical protein C8Q76DRAFT_405172 [Earliella scabrosa]|nr:hypothetical protein C8Q76DRAFT_405172 [Earliella scabrosa]
MNGVVAPGPSQPPLAATAPPQTHAHQAAPPRISPALLRGATQVSELIERRVNAVKTEYEDKLNGLVKERDALLARFPEKQPSIAVDAELATLRSERVQWEEQRRKLEDERDTLTRDRDEQARARLAAEEETRRLQEELQSLRVENAQLKETLRTSHEAALRMQVEDGRHGQPESGNEPSSGSTSHQISPSSSTFRHPPGR